MLEVEVGEHDRLSRVLIVEDDESQQFTLGSILEREGFEVIGCGTAAEAIEQLRSKLFGVAVVDLRLPDLGGTSLLEKINDLNQDVRVIIHTAFGSFDSAKESLNKGAFAYVEKAGDPNVLMHHIRRASRAQIRDYTQALEKAVAERTAALCESEERFRFLFENSNDCVVILDRDLNSLHANKSAKDYLELKDGETIEGKNIDEALHAFPEFRDLWIERLGQYFETGQPTHMEDCVQFGDRLVWSESSLSAIKDSSGNIIAAGIIYRDITERKQAEEELQDSKRRLELALKGADLGMWDWYVQTGKVIYDRRWREILEYAPEGKVSYIDFVKEHVHPDDLTTVMEFMDEHVAGRLPFYESEHRIRTESGGWKWVLDRGKIVERNQAGNALRVTGTIQDITERKQAEEEAAVLQEQMHQAQKMEAVGQLASGVAHDFNNLLMVIKGHAERARQVLPPNHEVDEMLKVVDDAANQASTVTRSLLTFTRKLPMEKKIIDLRSVIDQSMRMLHRLLPASIELVVDQAGEVPIPVHADEVQLQQVVLNLAINARDAMPNGGILTLLVTGPTGNEGGDEEDISGGGVFARIVVSDTGVGMTPEVRARIAEPFFTTKSRGKGTGLGMAVVHGIVANHCGTLKIHSEVGRGSTFVVELPCVRSVSLQDVMMHSDEVPPGQGETILLAEDNQQIRELMTSALVSLGYDVVQTGDGESLLAHFQKHKKETRLFILDVDLPKRNGLECLQAIRKAGSWMPAIMITGSADEGRDRLLDDNTTLLSKPFRIPELGRLVHKHLA